MERDSDMFNTIVGMNEHQVFVTLLSKYKILLGKEKATSKRKVEAAKALASEYNKECGKKFTVDRVYKKICNMKARLKEKNYKNLTRTKKLYYTDWEKSFLDMWVGDDTTVLPKKLIKSSDAASQAESSTSDDIVIVKTEKSINLLDETRQSVSNSTSHNIAMKIEPDDYEVQDSSCQISTVTSAPIWEIDSESETESEDDEDEKYASMSLDELKHAALVAQIESLKAQKSAARAKKRLSVYKLSFLRHRNGNR